jgi:hypothetical protein
VATGVVCASAGLQCGYDVSVTHCDKSVTTIATSCFCTDGVWKCPANEVVACVEATVNEAGSALVDAGSVKKTTKGTGSQGATSSCPYIYAWNGSSFEYQTDLEGEVLGLPSYSIFNQGIPFFRSTNVKLPTARYDDDRGITLRLRETLPENTYFDLAELVLVDHPAGFDAWTSDAESTWDGAYDVPFKMYTSRNARVPRTAFDGHGRDVLPALSVLDAHPAALGLNEVAEYTLDFGPIQHPEYAKLLLDAWAIYATAGEPIVVEPHVDAEGGDGRWVTVRRFGPPRGDRKTVVVDLSKRLPKGTRRLRVALGMRGPSMRWVVDRIRLDDSKPAPVKLTVLDPVSASLEYRGRATTHASTFQNPLEALDDEGREDPTALGCGAFTRYGDVRDLLTRADDQFVVMRHGDQITVTYPGAVPPPVGWTREVMLRGHAYYKNIVPGAVPDPMHPTFDRSTEPLPFMGMKDYPYDFPASYPDDDVHRAYRAKYNTRLFSAP